MEQRDLMSRSRMLVAFGAAVLFILGLLQIAQGFIDTKNYRDQIAALVKEKTGKDIVIKGKITASLLPAPALYIPGVELHGEGVKDTAPALSVGQVKVTPALLSLFSDQLQVSSVSFERPVLEIQHGTDGQVDLGWVKGVLLALAAPGRETTPVSVSIEGGKFIYRNLQADQEWSLAGIQAEAVGGAEPTIHASLPLSGREARFELKAGAPADGALPISARLSAEGQGELSWQGEARLTEETAAFKGNFAADVPDALAWVDSAAVASAKFPLKLSGEWAQENGAGSLSKINVQTASSTGAGEIRFAWKDKPEFAADLQFSALEYGEWQALVLALAEMQKRQQAAANPYAETPASNPLPKNVKFSLDAAAEKLSVNGQGWKNAALSAKLEDASITVNRFAAELPGAASLNVFGIVSQGTAKNLRFEGNMETQGKSLRDALSLLDPSASSLSDEGLGDFYIRSNIFISPEQMRLSEADVKIDELQLSGGLVAYFDDKPRIEADVRLKDIDFDYFRNVWRGRQQNAASAEPLLALDRSANFNWLRRLKTNVDFKVMVDHFTFLERQGDSAAFRLFAQPGEFGIYNARFYYPGDTVEASFNLNVNNETPFITLVFNAAGDLDTGYFKLKPGAEKTQDEPSKERWSKELIDMGWMEGVGGSFDISVGKLIHDGRSYDRFKMKSYLNNKTLTLQSLSFGYWDGRVDMTGSIIGGKVPGVSLGFTLTNCDIGQIIQSFTPRDNISGRLGVSGTLSTSGVNALSWAQQAESKLVLNGVGVVVDRFDLQGVVDTVSVSRTTADVVNNVGRVLEKGATEFSLEGNLNVKNGVVKTPGITLKSGNMLGNLTGEIGLVPWTMSLSTLFQFPMLASETVPTMVVELEGPVDEPALRLDTDSLEAYVSKRIVGQ